MRFTTSLMLIALSSSALLAQEALAPPAQRQISVSVASGPSGDREPQPKATPEEKKLGTQLLQRAETEAAGLQGGMRAYALLQVARGYEQSDRPKTIHLLQNAFTATRVVDDDKLRTRNKLQRQILSEMVRLVPDKVDDYLPQIDPSVRKDVLEALLSHYQKEKQLDHAIDLVYNISRQSEFPYAVASRLIHELPADQNAEVMQLFNTALGSFRDHKPADSSSDCTDTQHCGSADAFAGAMARMGLGADDFGEFILRNWKRAPAPLVKEAILEVLSRAEEMAKQQPAGFNHPSTIAMTSDKGSVRFTSNYEYRLFQLLPVLKHVDPDEADRLLKKHEDAEPLLAKYPEGAASFMPSENTGDASGDSTTGRGSDSGSGGRAKAPGKPPSGMAFALGAPIDMKRNMGLQIDEMEKAAKIGADAADHPQQALANAATIQNKSFRAQALMGIARVNVKKNPSVANDALSRAIDLVPDLPEPGGQMFIMREAANLYLQMDETDSAKKVVEQGLEFADKAYKDDANADDPNRALKAYWPSTEGYRSMLRVASKISPRWAASLLKDIDDPDVKVTAEAAMALQYMGMPAGRTEVVTSKKDMSMTIFSMDQ